jgi:hypothetical protein
MERAKRLELLRELLQACSEEATCAAVANPDVAGDAHTNKRGFSAEKVQAWADELDEIVRAWPIIGNSIQHGLMAIIRAQTTQSVRP